MFWACLAFILGYRDALGSSLGLDMNTPMTLQTWNTTIRKYNRGISFAVIQVWWQNGTFETTSATSIQTAQLFGIKNVSVYSYLCVPNSPYVITNKVNCGSPYQQLDAIVANLSSSKIFFQNSIQSPSEDNFETNYFIQRLYVSVEDESPNQYFHHDKTENINFLSDFTSYAASMGISIGIYTTYWDWMNIMDTSAFSHLPLWIPRFDSTPTVDFFVPFSGWTTLAMKQMSGEETVLDF